MPLHLKTNFVGQRVEFEEQKHSDNVKITKRSTTDRARVLYVPKQALREYVAEAIRVEVHKRISEMSNEDILTGIVR